MFIANILVCGSIVATCIGLEVEIGTVAEVIGCADLLEVMVKNAHAVMTRFI